MRSEQLRTYVAFFIFAVAILLLAYATDRSQSTQLIGIFAIAFAAYIFTVAQCRFTLKQLVVGAVLIRVALLFAPISWTDDHFRYVWDGLTVISGESPYMFLPQWIPIDIPYELYQKLNSKEFYSVYPPLVQIWSAASAWLGAGNVEWTTRIMRSFVILAEAMTFVALAKAIPATKPRARLVALYALNPLVIMELTVNLHTEFLMVVFCVLALLNYRHKKLGISSVFLGLAAAAKLWPLFFLALLPGAIGWKRSINYVATTLLVFAASWYPFYFHDMPGNVFASIKLYLSYFEFNSSLFGLFNATKLPVTVILMGLTVAGWLGVMIYRWKKGSTTFAEGMLWVMLIYFACASTVHPWYIVPLVALSTLTHYRWPILWSLLIIPTYLTYGSEPWQQPMWWVTIEYVVLFLFIALEMMIHTGRGMEARAKIKLRLLMEFLPNNSQLLDVGTGTGALAAMLQAEGHEVVSVDVVNKNRYPSVKPQVIDGSTLPFNNKQFDIVLLITMLHHTKTQEELLIEAKRVGKKVLVMEDVYTSAPQKWLTYLFDSLINLEFFGHPHSNRTIAGWRELFTKHGLEISVERRQRVLALFLQCIWVLENNKPQI